LVSIGIPTFNRAASLRRALASALAQTAPDVEVVVSDNASTDQTPEICREFARSHPRLRILRQAVNAGPTPNFRRVLEAATGEYFMWLGDDDWLDPRYVESCLESFRLNPAATLVVGATTFHDPDGGVVAEQPPREYRQRSAMARVCRYLVTVRDNSGFYGLMRRRELAAAGLDNVMAGDWLTVAAMAARGEVVGAPQARLRRRAAHFGGSSGDYRRMVATLGLPRVQGRLPAATIVSNVLRFYATQGPRTGLAAWQRMLLLLLLPGLFLVKGLSNPRFWLRAVGREPRG
jgi:glycosyltransferase involved in cell wall biosynthesis